MQTQINDGLSESHRKMNARGRTAGRIAGLLVVIAITAACFRGLGADTSDPLIELLIQKGMLTREEAEKVRAESEAIRTNMPSMPAESSKWKISDVIKNVELYGDIRLRYEHRQANTPPGDRIGLDRGRAAVRLGLRGEAFDHFYFGLRLETSSNPRSTWVTFGGSSPAPFGKSGFGVNVGQAYLGWRPTSWLDITAGKMPNPLYRSSMVWDSDLNPEGAAERFKYTAGKADFFANLGQFLYQDNNPDYISGSLVPYVSTRTSSSTDTTFLLAWQGGVNYRFTTNTSLKVGPALYQYIGLVKTPSGNGIGDAFIGEGAYGGPLSAAPIDGLTSEGGISYNQIGVNDLLVLTIPVEFNFRLGGLSARVFGDYAYNFEGGNRAEAAVQALAAQSAVNLSSPPLLDYGAQRNDVQAYQAGFALASKGALGLTSGSVCRKHAWEVRTYWQHVEQYALDPNLLDSDFFEGRGNLQGIYAAAAYGLTDNVIATVRYGYAWRINDRLGTGGSNLDIPQVNPIDHYSLLQLDLTLKF